MLKRNTLPLSSKTIPYENILEKIDQNKSCQCFWVQDRQKCKRSMEHSLPTHMVTSAFILKALN